MSVKIAKNVADFHCNPNRALARKFLLLRNDLPQRLAIEPFCDDVYAGLRTVCNDSVDSRMAKSLADLLFAVKSFNQSRVALHLWMGHLDGHRRVCTQVR